MCQYIISFYGWTVFHCVTYHSLFIIHSSADRHLGCFILLAGMKNTVMNMQVQVLFHYLTCFQFSWIYTRGEIVGSYGISIFNFPRNCHSGFYSSYTVLCSHQQCIPVPTFPHSHQHLLFSFFKKSIVILVAVKWYLVVLICIFLMAIFWRKTGLNCTGPLYTWTIFSSTCCVVAKSCPTLLWPHWL